MFVFLWRCCYGGARLVARALSKTYRSFHHPPRLPASRRPPTRLLLRASSKAYRGLNHAVGGPAGARPDERKTQQVPVVEVAASSSADTDADDSVAQEAPVLNAAPASSAGTGPEGSLAEQAGEEFASGTAMLGAQAAEGYAAAVDQVPEAWLVLLHHADAAVLSGVFTCCRGGRDLVLQHVRRLTVKLQCPSQETDLTWQQWQQWQQRLQAVRQALSVRGARPTSVFTTEGVAGPTADGEREQGSSSCPLPPASASQVAAALQGVGQGVDKLTVEVWLRSDINALLHQMARTFPNVTSLEITYCFEDGNYNAVIMPPPSQWPRLTSLKLTLGDQWHKCRLEEMLPCIAPYMSQLRTLSVLHGFGFTMWSDIRDWGFLFPLLEGTTLPLVRLEVDSVLNDNLLDNLLTHTPHLKHLYVGGIDMQLTNQSDRVWELEEFRIGDGSGIADAKGGFAHLWDLAVLPMPRTGRVSFAFHGFARDQSVDFHVMYREGMDDIEGETLSAWRFNVENVIVHCTLVARGNQPTALRNTLQQFAKMQAPDATISFRGWDAAVVTAALAERPLLPHLRLEG